MCSLHAFDFQFIINLYILFYILIFSFDSFHLQTLITIPIARHLVIPLFACCPIASAQRMAPRFPAICPPRMCP